MKKSVIIVLFIVSMFLIAGCKEGAVGGNIGSKSSTLSKTVNKTASAVNYGDLVVSSKVWDVDIYLDGAFQGRLSPNYDYPEGEKLDFIAEGSRFKNAYVLVEVKKDGYETFSKQVTLRPRQSVFVNVELKPVVTIDCTDTDGGITYSIKGMACSGSKCDTDSCQSSKILMENDCGYENGIINSAHNGLGGSSYECPNGCKDGACTLNQTVASPQQSEQRLIVGEYSFFDSGRLKVSCNSQRTSNSAFSNNTQVLANGTISGFAEHYLIVGEYVNVFGKKVSCNS